MECLNTKVQKNFIKKERGNYKRNPICHNLRKFLIIKYILKNILKKYMRSIKPYENIEKARKYNFTKFAKFNQFFFHFSN